ncbi:Peroxisome membrane anchor protein Pex14p, N-terminal domain-containing protein [Strongyloides ratti]|uniref:Peroxisomal membrane protein PEX14 n=1 Tax=Strongyloides ratti TaxID=34506 RepID=A0A090L6L5_STRRB|nr:Peroxisome membrane anchor protein Pex14p, N-terminal domain-containing protein [Strongyloides ratti]CEF63728.1 Peroxisome membrane anchor protein Pex14p, N-terminal domain-containing protein [Strongyloides ratti]
MSNDGIRNEMVEAAVKFMTNAKVRSTSITEQKNFLKEKGLTDEEISKAIEEVGYISSNKVEDIERKPIQHQGSIFSKIQNIIVWCGALYGSYTFIRNYILPDEKFKNIEKQVSELHNSIKFLTNSTSQTLSIIQEQEKILSNLMQILSKNVEKDLKVNEVYNDISTIKKLLLGKDQFPSVLESKLNENNTFQAILMDGDKQCNVPTWQLPYPKDSLEYENESLDDNI